MDTLNMSSGVLNAPQRGDHISMLERNLGVTNRSQDSARLAALYENLRSDAVTNSMSDDDIVAQMTDDSDGMDDKEEDLDMLTPPSTGITSSRITRVTAVNSDHTKTETEEISESSSERSDAETEEPEDSKNIMPFVLAGVAVVIIIIIICISKASSSKKAAVTETSNSTTTSTVADVVTDASQTFYADTLSQNDVTVYRDVMTIDKYIVLYKDSCQYVFEGYAENARAFVKAYVDLDIYNRYKTGARVAITYERITLSGKDYYMKVEVLQDES